ncbi:MAG: CDP-alcohol phosphatidyltransferase family protein [Bacteroidetes bacterium]|nr:CDP-alcohol phosphatidyltransferase family protein [Bacteroidota bacterium]MCL2302116.1 CDP-alcohol phosphatidyltransferase family protein [Lentimicrobiaceae bacterium]
MKKHIPNLLTCCNVLLGSFSIVFAFKGFWETAALLILGAAIFDFLDGFAARLLNAKSAIGVDLDSLADVISFGLAPAAILFMWMEFCFANLPPELHFFPLTLLPYFAFIIVPFSAYRLAKFNNDKRQEHEFYGLATPANTFFIAFLPFAADKLPLLDNFWALLGLTFIFSILLVLELPMFSLKFSNYNFKKNLIRYLFLILSAILLVAFQLAAFPIIILLYIFISLIQFGLTKILHS